MMSAVRIMISAVRKIQGGKMIQNKKFENWFKIKDRRENSLKTNPHGDKSSTARFVVPVILSHAENSKTEHTQKNKIRTQYKTCQKSMQLIKFMGGTPPL